MRKLIFLCLALPGLAFAQSAEDVSRFVKTGDLGAARAEAQKFIDAGAGAEIGWHILGCLSLAEGQAEAALDHFKKALESATSGKLTGLEDGAAVGTSVHAGLRRLRPSIALSAGKAAAHNNIGACLLLLDRPDEAKTEFDIAAGLETSWGVPWHNASLALLELRGFDAAEKAIRMALALGERNARVFASLAEIDFALGRFDRVPDDLKQCFELDPTHPYGLLVKSELGAALGKARDSERASIQASLAGPEVPMNSILTKGSGEALSFGGNGQELHVHFAAQGYRKRSGYRLLGLHNRARIENRTNTDQELTYLDGGYATRDAFLSISHREQSGNRPGASGTIIGVTPTPGAYYRFKNTLAHGLQRFQIGSRAQLYVHGAYRRSEADLTTAAAGKNRPLSDTQWMAETRLDWIHRADTSSMIGYAYTVNRRTGTGPRPVEPVETSLSTGKQVIWSAYAVHRRPIFSFLDVTAGVMVGSSGGVRQVQPLLDLNLKGPGGRGLALRVTPRFVDAVSNLIPLDLVAEDRNENPIDRRELTPTGFNRTTILQGQRSRMIDFDLSFTDGRTSGIRTETTVFHRRLTGVNILGADPRVSTALSTSPLSSGEVTGIEEKVRYDFSDRWSLRGLFRFQKSVADFDNPTLSAESFPASQPVAARDIPNIPRYQANLRLDYLSQGWLAGLEAAYVSKRDAALTRTTNGTPTTYLLNASPQVGVNFILQKKLSDRASLSFKLFNLLGASFYPGYPGKPTGVLGFEMRF